MKKQMLSRLGRNCVGQAMPDRENTAWKNEIRLTICQAEPDLPITTTRGFTLIELLVVVLIIGILAAVAVPQYQNAVEKAKAAQAITLLKSIVQAEATYLIANGNRPNSLDELGIEISWPTCNEFRYKHTGEAYCNADWILQLSKENAPRVVRRTGKHQGAEFRYYAGDTVSYAPAIPTNEIICCENKSNALGIDIIYALPAGSYCQKLFHGTLKYEGWAREYALP